MIKETISKAILEVAQKRFSNPQIFAKDHDEPSEENPIVRFVLVSPSFAEGDHSNKAKINEVMAFFESEEVFRPFTNLWVLVQPMAEATYIANGNSIEEDESDEYLPVDREKSSAHPEN